jgi:glucose-1-phosphate thymidylyltransferase
LKGLLLAGGHGTRLRPLTLNGNKHMIPIANKPMLFYGLQHLAQANIREIGIILGPINEGIREAIGDGSKFNVKITYISQPEPLGLAHAVQISEDFIKNEPFIMYLGDNLLRQGVVPLIRKYYNEGSNCVICVTPVRYASQYGIVELDSFGHILRLVEKPKSTTSNLALTGAYLFDVSIFDAVKNIKPSWRSELEITDAIQLLLEQGKKISIQHTNGWWKDTGKPEDLLEANQLVLDDLSSKVDDSALIQPNSLLVGKVSIGKNTIIESNSKLKGPIIIGNNCKIGANVYIGPYTSIGDDSKILSGEVEGSIIMDDVLINCNRRIVDSIIGRRSQLEFANASLPSGLKFILGENTICRI